jgi:hypothetical protein
MLGEMADHGLVQERLLVACFQTGRVVRVRRKGGRGQERREKREGSGGRAIWI